MRVQCLEREPDMGEMELSYEKIELLGGIWKEGNVFIVNLCEMLYNQLFHLPSPWDAPINK